MINHILSKLSFLQDTSYQSAIDKTTSAQMKSIVPKNKHKRKIEVAQGNTATKIFKSEFPQTSLNISLLNNEYPLFFS